MRPLYGYFLTGKHLNEYLALRRAVDQLPDDGHYLKFADPIVQQYVQFVQALPAIWHTELKKRKGIHLATRKYLTNALDFATKHCEETFHNDKENEYLWIADLEIVYDNNTQGLSKLEEALADWYPSDFGAVAVTGTLPDVVYKIYPLTKATFLDIVLACFEPCVPEKERDKTEINPQTSFWNFKKEKKNYHSGE